MNNIETLRGSFCYGMHGMGLYQGCGHTNSLEAYQYWYARGIRFFEVDLALTDDNRCVALAHIMDKETLERMEVYSTPPKECYMSDWFLSQKLFSTSTKGLTPLSLEDIFELMNVHEDTVFMLDTYKCLNLLNLLMQKNSHLLSNQSNIAP